MTDRIPPEEAIAANRALWDAWTRAHRDSAFYDVAGFLAGRDPLSRIETEELGDVAGKRFLHLQCHFGIDTLGWARRGAHVTGVDFSPKAIATARRLAEQAGLEATFVESDVYELDEHTLGEFELVHSSYGVLAWLPDLDRWADIVASHLLPGGLFHLVENHPFTMMLNDDGVAIRWPYLATGVPIRFESVAERIRLVGEAQVYTSIIVVAELRYGATKKGSARLTAQLGTVLGALEVLPFEGPADATYGALRSRLEKAGQTIGGNDLLIAAQAVTLSFTLVTDNEREFGRIPELSVENWLR